MVSLFGQVGQRLERAPAAREKHAGGMFQYPCACSGTAVPPAMCSPSCQPTGTTASRSEWLRSKLGGARRETAQKFCPPQQGHPLPMHRTCGFISTGWDIKAGESIAHLFLYPFLFFNNPPSSGTGPPGVRWAPPVCGLCCLISPARTPAPSGHGPPPAGCLPGCEPCSAKSRCHGR